jgi:hypothetical protein
MVVVVVLFHLVLVAVEVLHLFLVLQHFHLYLLQVVAVEVEVEVSLVVLVVVVLEQVELQVLGILPQQLHHKEILVEQVVQEQDFLEEVVEEALVLAEAVGPLQQDLPQDQVEMDCQHLVEMLEFQLLMEHQDQHLEDGLQVAVVVENGVLPLVVSVVMVVLAVEVLVL